MHTTLVGKGHTRGWDRQPCPRPHWCDDAMFQIEHLLVEIEALHIEKRARDEKDQ